MCLYQMQQPFSVILWHAHSYHATFVFRSSTCRDKIQPHSRVTLRDLQKSSANSRPAPNATTTSSGPSPAPGPTSSLAVHSEQPDTLLLANFSLTAAEKSSSAAADPYDNISLADVTVPLESIKPSKRKR